MQWVLQQIVNILETGITWVLIKPIGFILTELAKALFSILTVLLKLTIFQPFTLHPAANGSNIVAGAAQSVWIYMAGLSVFVALVALLWAAFTNTWGSVAGRSQFSRSGWADALEGLGIWLLVLIGGYGFLSMLLDATNAVTTGFVNLALSYQFQSVNGATIGAGVIAAILADWLWPSMLLVLAGFMIWAVVVWVMRMVDLVVFTGLLPLTAALAITGNKQAWQWNWAEAVGAVFSQVAMAIMWWIAWLFIGGKLVHVNGSFGNDVVRLLMGLAAMTLVAKAPQMLQSITGHRHAGVGGLAMAAAGGYMIGRTAMAAARMTPLGQAVGKVGAAVTQRSQNRLNEWAHGPDIAHGPIAQKAGALMDKATAAGKQVLGGALNTPTGQVISGVAGQMKSFGSNAAQQVGQKAWGAFTNASPATAARVAAGASMAGQSIGAGARRVADSASSAANTVLQPNRSLGRAAINADATNYGFGAANEAHDFAVRAGATGYEAQFSPQQRGAISDAYQQMIMAKTPAEYERARIKLENASTQAREQVLHQVMDAPNGASAYQMARERMQRRGPQPRPTAYV